MRAGSSRRRCSPRPVSASTPSTSLGGNALVNAPIATRSPSRCGAGGLTCPARGTTPPPHPPPTQRTRTIPHQRGLTDRHWGYTGFTVDDTYTAATAQAARSWQADLGLPKTGAVEPGQLVVIPGAVRVAEHTARVGERIGGDTGGGASVLSYTGTTRLVTVELEVADQALAAKSRTVTVTVPGQGPVKGKIAQVGTVATAPEQTGNAPGDQASNAPGGSSSTAPDARIQVTATIADQKKLGSLDGAPVDVDFVSQEREDVLAVPVAALLALPKGGYGVQIVQGGATRIVAVKTGMFAAGRVEISGDGIAEGLTVGMPK